MGDDAAVDEAAVSADVAQAKQAVMSFGKAQVGDKTMINTVVPFADDFTGGVEAGRSLREAWQNAATVAEQSTGTSDPGAVSFALVCATVVEELGRAGAAAAKGSR